MDELVTWLRAQLDDEATLNVHLASCASVDCGCGNPCDCGFAEQPAFTAGAASGWLPGRWEREVEAKRRIVDLHSSSHECSTFESSCDWFDGDGDACSTLLLVALPYSDRPGYRDEWKP